MTQGAVTDLKYTTYVSTFMALGSARTGVITSLMLNWV